MKKTMRKLIPAVLMLLISAMLVGTSTYAWFAMNSKVTVTGMTVDVKVSDNILIAATNTSDANYTGGLHQVRTGRLAPVSTVNGESFFYANSQDQVLGSGASKGANDAKQFTAYSEAKVGEDPGTNALTNTNANKSFYDTSFQAQAGITGEITTSNVAYGYLDYEFYIKATNASASTAYLNMTVCNLLYNGGSLVTTSGKEDRAWRVAVFVNDSAKETTTDGLGTLKTILAPAGATYYVPTNAATSTTALGGVTNLASRAQLKAIGANATVYEKITVRLWIEGEDNRCTNDTYTELNGKWTLDLAFAIGASEAGANAIQSTVITTSGADTATGSITLTASKLSNGETPFEYAWKNATDDGAATGTNNAATYTATAAGDFYCLITTTDGNIYRTANIHLVP